MKHTDLLVGDMLRNIHTQECHELEGMCQVNVGNGKIYVYIINKSRWDFGCLSSSWEKIAPVGSSDETDYLYGVSYEVS